MPAFSEPDPNRDPRPGRPARPEGAHHGRPTPARDDAPADALLLFETEHGRVRRCDCCDTLRIHMGNAMMAAEPEGYAQLLETVAAFDRGDTPLGPWPAGRALLHLGDSGAAFAFTPAEIAELHRLLAGAQLMLDLGAAGDA